MIKLIKSTFFNEEETRAKLAEFLLKPVNLSMGEECKKFERSFSNKQERKHSVFVSSGSAANLILVQALLNLGYLKKGDSVALSSVTWATNIMPVIQLGLCPILLDCEKENLNVSKKILAKFYEDNKSIKAFFITNVLGFSADLEEISIFCKENGILLIEDNCESLGSRYKGKLLGNFGLASTFSFYVGHHMSTIEGGMVCTDDEKLRNMLVMVRAHGWDRNLEEVHQKEIRKAHNVEDFFHLYTFYELGYNVRPTEINGFLGNLQINYLDEIVSKRHKNYDRFISSTKKNEDIFHLDIKDMDRISNFAFPVIFKSKELFLKYKKLFQDNSIEIRPIISGNIGNQPFFKKHSGEESNNCPNASIIHSNGFYFANNPEMTESELDIICSLIENGQKL